MTHEMLLQVTEMNWNDNKAVMKSRLCDKRTQTSSLLRIPTIEFRIQSICWSSLSLPIRNSSRIA